MKGTLAFFIATVTLALACGGSDSASPTPPTAASTGPDGAAPGVSSTPEAGAPGDDDATPEAGPPGDAASDASAPRDPVVAWYTDGMTTGTGSANDFTTFGNTVDATSITAAELATLIETNKYSGQPREKTVPVDFDEVFLTRAQTAGFMTKLGTATAKVIKDGYPEVIVYNNGPNSMSQATTGGWKGIAKAGAMVGLEAYTTTFETDVKAANTAHPFQDNADLNTSENANPALFTALQGILRGYVTSTKTQLGNDALLGDHITLLQFENMTHDIATLQGFGFTQDEATHFAQLWYAALEVVAASENVHWGIFHPA